MNSDFILLVRSRTGTARMLADLARLRAAELGLTLTILPEPEPANPGLPEERGESVTAVVPVAFAGVHHEAWCLLCQLSLMRREVSFAILVLGAHNCADFEARQRALLAGSRTPRSTANLVHRSHAA